MKKSSFILSALLLASALFTVGCSLNAKSEPIPFKSNYDKVQYKMVCYFQDIGSPSYSINKKYTKTYSGKPGELTAVVPPVVEGFTLQAEPTQVPIAGDYSTVVEVTYSRNFYYVHYDTNGGNTMYSSFFQYGSKVNITQKPVRAGYTFTGWYPEVPATMPTHDITLTAQWIEGEATPYKVEHYLQNADNNFYTLDFTDDKAGRTNSQTKATAKKYPNFTVQPFTQESISPEGDTVVLIFYNRKTFTIEFDTDGGSSIAPAEYKFEQTVTPPADPTKDLYLFKEWNPELPATMPDEDIEVKAVWEQPTYTITYKDQNNNDFSGTLGTNTPTTHTYGTATTLVSPTKTGYNFDGWYLDSACTNSIVTALTATGYISDITIYAKFTPKQFTITYNLNGGTNPMGTPTTHTYGTATTLPTPIKTGYLFKGWYTTSGFSDTVLTTLGATDYTSEIFLYAKWIEGVSLALSDIENFLTTITDTTKVYTIQIEDTTPDLSQLKTILNNNTDINFSFDLSGCTGLTTVGYNAFYDCTNLYGIELPISVTSIGYYAFSYCSGLTSVTIPSSVTSIGDYAFYNCSDLTSVTITVSVTSIGNYAFYNCSGLTSVTIPTSVTSIGSDAFSNCNNLSQITVDANNTKYDSRDNCNGIIETSTNTLVAGCKNTVIPTSVTSIGFDAFGGCSGLASVTIPTSVTSIGYSAFRGCSGLTSVTIPTSVTSIGNYAFYNCSGLTSVKIPTSVTSIGYGAFKGCSGLTSVTIPSSVTFIDNYAFENCSGLASVTIPTSVTSIGNSAFRGCSGLTSVTIPTSVTSIGSSAFYGCTKLQTITFEDTTTWYRTTSSSDWENKTGGTQTDVSTTTTNATNFKINYYDYYWYKL